MSTYNAVEFGIFIAACVFAFIANKTIPLPPSDDGEDNEQEA